MHIKNKRLFFESIYNYNSQNVKLSEVSFTMQYFIKGFFVRKDNDEIDKKYLSIIYDDGKILWSEHLKRFDNEGRKVNGALWFKNLPSEEHLKKFWNSQPIFTSDEKNYKGLVRLEVWQAPKFGYGRWKQPSKVLEFKSDEQLVDETNTENLKEANGFIYTTRPLSNIPTTYKSSTRSAKDYDKFRGYSEDEYYDTVEKFINTKKETPEKLNISANDKANLKYGLEDLKNGLESLQKELDKVPDSVAKEICSGENYPFDQPLDDDLELNQWCNDNISRLSYEIDSLYL